MCQNCLRCVKCLFCYPSEKIELVGLVADVDEGDYDEGRVAVVVEPLSDSGGCGDDVSLADFADLLVSLFGALSLRRRNFISIRATREHRSVNTPTCMQQKNLN